MNHIYYQGVNNIFECNSIYGILNSPKRTKYINRHYSPIIRGCMNKRKGKVKFENFRVLLDGGCSSMIVTRGLAKKLKLKNILCNNARHKWVILPLIQE